MTRRSCQPCTACCDGWVRMTISGQPVHPGRPCVHSTGGGCNDYENRPDDPCRRFACGWVIDGSPLPDWMKPNEARAMVLFNHQQWRGHPVDLVLPVGHRVPGRTLSWMKSFVGRTGRLLLIGEAVREGKTYTGQVEVVAYGPPEFLDDMVARNRSGQFSL